MGKSKHMAEVHVICVEICDIVQLLVEVSNLWLRCYAPTPSHGPLDYVSLDLGIPKFQLSDV